MDECRTTSAQTHILNALSIAVKHLHIPLCFLVASRPEQDIRQAFNDQNGLGSLSFSIALDDTYRLMTTFGSSFNQHLMKSNDNILQRHTSPRHGQVHKISGGWYKKSSGQFIFASTVAKYINSYRHWPPDRLENHFWTISSGPGGTLR
jgi:hypothetical protein